MPASLKSYPAYKPSGVEWLGDVPAHWGVKKIKHGYDIQLGKMLQPDKKSSKDIEKPYLRAANLSWEGALLEDVKSMWFSPEELEKFKLQKGDVLISEGGDVGRSCYWGSDLELYIQNAMTRARSKSEIQFSKYLYYWMYHLKNIGQIDSICNAATIAHFTADKVKETLLFEPPIDEQHSIAAFLDQKTAEIDAAISKKQRLIELLKEQKTILINQAVTKGLNPNVLRRDSGVEWIGEVPAHWGVKRVKYFSSVQGGITLGRSYSDNNLESYPYLRVANVQDGYFNLDAVTELSLPKWEAEQYFVRVGDILVTEGGDIDKLGRGTVWEGEIENCLHQNHIFAVRIDKRTATEHFIALVMACDYGRHYFTATANKTTNLASTNRTKLGNFPIALPPLDEQMKLVNYSKRIGREYEKVIEIVSKELERLNEFRCSLIASTVTGKIRV